MTKEEFKILVEEYGVPIEAAERFTVEENGIDYKQKYEELSTEYADAKERYLDIVFSKKPEKKEEEEEEKTLEETYIEEVEREV